MLPRRVAAVLLAACLVLGLAACSEDVPPPRSGDVIPAREPDQFGAADGSVVLVPSGRLDIRLGEIKTAVGADDTRDLEPLSAPADTVLVPLTVQYRDDWFSRLETLLAPDDAPLLELRVGESAYRLPAPSAQGEGVASYYVVVDGSADEVADDAELDVVFDDVAQTVVLGSGKVEKGAAAALYDLPTKRLPEEACGNGWFEAELALADFGCTTTGGLPLPYAAGAWATDGRALIGTGLSTVLRRYDVLDESGTSGGYVATSVRGRYRAGDVQPVVLRGTSEDNICPEAVTLACRTSNWLVFDFPEDEVARRAQIEQNYRMVLGGQTGDFPGDRRLTLSGGGTVPLSG